jgi:2-polyprenyl-6-hydroxyphenyl methylase/3-demethylubiquinone-9 3-methyltransferase
MTGSLVVTERRSRWERRDLVRKTLALYDDSPSAERLFVHVRAFLSDLPAVEERVPRNGQILDLGCGHGLLTNLLAQGSAERDVLGIDIDADKVEAARRTIKGQANVRFEVVDAADVHGGPFDAITVGDVFYLIPPEGQRSLIERCFEILAPGGVFVWKSQVRQPRWKYAITYGQEWLMTHLGPTSGHGLYFLDTDESLAALRDAGFQATALPLRSWRPYTDVLFIAEKPR